MSIMRDIGRQIGQQKTALRLPGMGRAARAPVTVNLGQLRANRAAGGPPAGGPPMGRAGAGPGPGPMAGRRPGQRRMPNPGQDGLMGILQAQAPRLRDAAGTVGSAARFGLPGGILANRLIAALAAQNQMEGDVNQAVGDR